MAKNKLTQIIEEQVDETPVVSQPLVGKTTFRSDADAPPVVPEQEQPVGEFVTRTRPEKPQTVTGTRVFEIGDASFTLTRRDPYGMWFVKADKGRTPDKLKGMYTNAQLAEKDITVYMNNRSA